LIGVGSGLAAAIVVIVLVVTLVVAPNQRAATQAQAEQEHQDAATAFDQASQACTGANQKLASAIYSAQQAVKTDPATLQDPSLIDKLNQAITTAQTVASCTVPTMADDTAAIQQQTTQMNANAQTVASAASSLTLNIWAVTTSVEAKENADYAAKKAAVQTGSIALRDSQGYTYTLAVSWFAIAGIIDTTHGKPGNVMLTVAPGVDATITNTTMGKVAPTPLGLDIFPVFGENPCEAGNLEMSHGGCWTATINGATYWTFSAYDDWIQPDVRLTFSGDPMMNVNETREDSPGTHTDDRGVIIEIPQLSSSAVAHVLNNPAGWILATTGAGTDFVRCDNSVVSSKSCVLGMSDSLK